MEHGGVHQGRAKSDPNKPGMRQIGCTGGLARASRQCGGRCDGGAQRQPECRALLPQQSPRHFPSKRPLPGLRSGSSSRRCGNPKRCGGPRPAEGRRAEPEGARKAEILRERHPTISPRGDAPRRWMTLPPGILAHRCSRIRKPVWARSYQNPKFEGIHPFDFNRILMETGLLLSPRVGCSSGI